MARSATVEEREISAPDGKSLRLVVVADSHSRPHPRALDAIASVAPDAILHAGDIGNLDVLDELAALAPTIAVRGNIDAANAAPDDVALRLSRQDKPDLRILLTHIAVAGPRLRRDVRTRAEKHGAALVICGHSHVPLIAEDRGLWIFNPGSYGPRRFQLPIVFGILRLGEKGLAMEHLDCETQKLWRPPRAA